MNKFRPLPNPIPSQRRARSYKDLIDEIESLILRTAEKLTVKTETPDRMKEFRYLCRLRLEMYRAGLDGNEDIERWWKRCFSLIPKIRRKFRTKLESIVARASTLRMARFAPEIAPEIFSESEQKQIQVMKDAGTLPVAKLIDAEVAVLHVIQQNSGLGWSQIYKLSGLSFKQGAPIRKNLEAAGVVETNSKRTGKSGRPKETPFLTKKGVEYLREHFGLSDANEDENEDQSDLE